MGWRVYDLPLKRCTVGNGSHQVPQLVPVMDTFIWIAVAALIILFGLLAISPRMRQWFLSGATLSGRINEGDSGFGLEEIEARGPPGGPYSMEFYGTPVCLRFIVLAPLGRVSELPENDHLPHILNHFMTGFTRIVSAHRSVLIRWPEQLSASGFQQAFFNHAGLPGDHGRGSCWSAMAGRFSMAGSQYLLGLVFSTADADGLGEVVVKREGQWQDMLRIREQST